MVSQLIRLFSVIFFPQVGDLENSGRHSSATWRIFNIFCILHKYMITDVKVILARVLSICGIPQQVLGAALFFSLLNEVREGKEIVNSNFKCTQQRTTRVKLEYKSFFFRQSKFPKLVYFFKSKQYALSRIFSKCSEFEMIYLNVGY